MGTRSGIGYILPDGRIKAVYCHWDGYPDHHLPILTQHYTNLKEVKKLIANGAISSLRTQQASFDAQVAWDENNNPIKNEHGYTYTQNREPQPLYYKERGDDWDIIKPDIFDKIKNYLNSYGGEYFYLYCPRNIRFDDFLRKHGFDSDSLAYSKSGRWFYMSCY